MNFKRLIVVAFALLALVFLGYQPALAQSTVGSGSVTGIVSDPQGAAVPGAKVTITNPATNQSVSLETNSAGVYNSGPLAPGSYLIKVESPNFKTTQVVVANQIGQITAANVKLELGSASTIVEVKADAIAVNEEQASVQDVLTATDIDQLPVNGRNFLDLATLEPGVQIQDGSTFDPTKNGYSSLSFGGRFGRSARIEVDGVDISDETVGTVTQNIPESAISEFQVASSTLDLSTELTSSGTVNVVTKSGTNDIHGAAYYYGRSDQISARIAPTDLPFGRKQDGVNLGGPLDKNKLFFFGDLERTDQSLASPVSFPSSQFGPLSGSYNSPFTEREYLARVDYNVKPGWTAFYRFAYDQNFSARGFNPGVYQPFANVDHTGTHVAGTDFTTGGFTHSIRFEFLKFRNAIADAVAASGSYDPTPGISTNITPFGSADLACLAGGEAFCSGANILAPQATFQEDRQIKYDGSYTLGRHVLRYGTSYNGILGGGFAKFFALQPMVESTYDPANIAIANTGTFTCTGPTGSPETGASCPLNWPVDTVLIGNGQGFSTERPGFNLPAGGQYDHRFDFYVGDQWKFRPNITLTFGLHYGRDAGRTDSDLGTIAPLAMFDNSLFKNLEDPVHQPNLNFGPQIGIAWDPWSSGKTVIRLGAGIYYENAIFNNVLFDRPGRLLTGEFLAEAAPCFGGGGTGGFEGVPAGASYCGESLGSATSSILAEQAAYQGAVAAGGSGPNPNYIGSTLYENNLTGITMLAPNYRSPYSIQMNGGVQRQFGHGTVLSVDYERNVSLHYLLGVDTNEVGNPSYLNTGNAVAAISTTNAGFGCGASASAGATNCAINHGAIIDDYAGNGLDSDYEVTGGAPCSICAFQGINSAVGQNEMLFPIGRSVYNGLLVSLKSTLNHPMPGMNRLNLIASYTLSRFDSMATDQDFVNNALDFNNPGRFYGPSALDRTHQVSVGAIMDLPLTTRIALATHWDTAAPLSLFLPQVGGAQIFKTDVTGDGTIGDPVPGTNIGAFGRSIKASDLNSFINNYNSKDAGTLTPAGQSLVTAGLFTQTELQQLNAVEPTLALAPPGNVGLSPLFTFDMHASWEIKLTKLFHAMPERVVLEPQVSLFNVFNFHNFDPFGAELSGALTGTVGSANGTTKYNSPNCALSNSCTGRSNEITPGSSSGVNWYAVPRQAEFGAKITF
ncbi:MAG: carboxypeptidase regulatory-like domain-containing protein [Candidatus Acidiferrales bacterium]